MSAQGKTMGKKPTDYWTQFTVIKYVGKLASKSQILVCWTAALLYLLTAL